MIYAEIAINRNLTQGFTYHIPSYLQGKLAPGHMVRVSFRTAQEAGIVINLTNIEPPFATKPILERLDPNPVLSPIQLALAKWLAHETMAPIGPCLWLMLPPGFTPRSDQLYHLLNPEGIGENQIEKQIISLLNRRGALTSREVVRTLGEAKKTRRWINSLLERGILEAEAALSPPDVKPKVIRTVQLAIAPEHISLIATRLGRESRRANVLEVLWAHPQRQMPVADILEIVGCKTDVVQKLQKAGDLDIVDETVHLLLDDDTLRSKIITMRGGQPYLDILDLLAQAEDHLLDVSTIYSTTGTELRHLNRLHEDGFIIFAESEVWRDSLADKFFVPDMPPPLTDAQQAVWEPILEHLEAPKNPVFLIHGVTGSGKTEIYMRAVEHVLGQGRQAIVLVPEIALTTQMVKRFARRFPGQVALIHSTLSPGERYDTWRRIREGGVQVVIGARSALFAPLPDVGLIVLDEEHDDSYKQSPPIMPPYYHARETAIQYMHMNHGTVILGSATPDVGTYFHAKLGNIRLLHLPDRILAHREQVAEQIRQLQVQHAHYTLLENSDAAVLPLPPVHIVDMRHELRAGHTSIFSRALTTALHEVLALGQQALLFLNRRGTATFVFCRDCGYIARCPRCDNPLTYHQAGDKLTCHHCGHREPNPQQCPECDSKRIKYFGRGTEQLEKVLHDEFPNARVLRWDKDTASKQGAHEAIFEAFAARQADVLVGTQMITKGLDLPLVTLVGIVSADTALGLPDFRANENTFQLLTQVAGRAGRSPLGGRVILQTYQPNHYAIQAAAAHDYHAFYAREIEYRRKLRWTPFTRLVRLLFQDAIEAKAEEEARRIAHHLRERISTGSFTASEVIGPVPCFFGKRDGLYRWHILIRTQNPSELLEGFNLGSLCMIDIDPLDIL